MWISAQVRRFSRGYPHGAMCCDSRELGGYLRRRCAGSGRLWITPPRKSPPRRVNCKRIAETKACRREGRNGGRDAAIRRREERKHGACVLAHCGTVWHMGH